jgi:hypothetical protein
MNTPKHATDDQIAKLFDDELRPAVALNEAFNRIEAMMDHFFSAKSRKMVYDEIPVGHDIGYRCYDGSKHDADSAYRAGEFGDGLTQDQAYADWSRNVDPDPRPRAGIPYAGNGNSEPYEYKDDPVTFDDDLEDPRD